MSSREFHQSNEMGASQERDRNNLRSLQPSKTDKPIKNWQLAIATTILLGMGFLLGQKFQLQQPTSAKVMTTKQQTNILPVMTTTIEPVASYSRSQTYTGEVEAGRTSEVGFERGGKLIKVLVEEGDLIFIDTPLAELDTANLEAQRQGLIAQKEQAEAVLAELKNGARTEQINAAQANVRDLERQLELENLKSDRRKYLYQEGAIAEEQLDEIAFNRQALAERLANAQSNLNELQNGTRIEQITAQQAAVNQLKAEIKNLDITIEKSIIRSPFKGIVASRNLDEGTVVEAGRSILRLVENAQPKVKIGVPVALVNQIQPGSQQKLTIAGEEYSATVSSILPEVNVATRTRTVVLKLPISASDSISPQQIARLSIVTQTNHVDGYWLPIGALVKGDRGLWSCYAVVNAPDGKYQAERRYIELLETDEDRVLVRGTIQPGDEIITDGVHRLVSGQIVKRQ